MFPNPGNVVVGLTSDLIIEVQCTTVNGVGTEVFTWSQNGITVPGGLQVFGVSQGGNGILRGNPAQELLQSGGSQFVCSDNSGNTLDVVFTPGNQGGCVSVVMGVACKEISACVKTLVCLGCGFCLCTASYVGVVNEGWCLMHAQPYCQCNN